MTDFVYTQVNTVSLAAGDTITVAGLCTVRIVVGTQTHTDTVLNGSARYGPFGAAAILTIQGTGSYQYDRSGDITPSGPILLTSAEIASPTAAILADTTATYIRAIYPFDELKSNGTYLIPRTESGQFDALTKYTDWFTNFMRKNATLLAPPARAAAFKPASNVYIDPSVVGPGSGTFGDPFKVWPAMAANTAYLLKEGQTYLGALTVTLTNTITTPTIIGVYEAVNGTQILKARGRATISANSATPSAITIAASSAYVGVHGVAVAGASNNTGAGIDIANLCANIQVLNCVTDNYIGVGIQCSIAGTSTNIIIEGNSCFQPAGAGGIVVGGNGIHTGMSINYNAVDALPATRRGIYVIPFVSTGGFVNLTVACNTVTNCVNRGIAFENGFHTNTRVFRNSSNLNLSGIAFSLEPSTDVLVQNNECCENAEFGIHNLSKGGAFTIEWNRCWRNGSLTAGVSAGSANKYGRGIELAGTALGLTTMVRDTVIRFNSCCQNYNFNTQSTEGVGIGLDNYVANIDAYGNYCARNEGNGIQLFLAIGCQVYGNFLVTNFQFPNGLHGTSYATIPGPEYYSELRIGDPCQACEIFNNTIVCGAYGKYGISEGVSNNNKNMKWRNNLIYGAVVAGLSRYSVATTESTNAFEACAASVFDAQTNAVTASGSGDVTGTWVLPPFYKLQLSASIAASGANIDAAGMNPLQELFGNAPPIGAFKAVI